MTDTVISPSGEILAVLADGVSVRGGSPVLPVGQAQGAAPRLHVPGLAHLRGQWGHRTLLDEAVRFWELSPSVETHGRAAWHSADEIARITGVPSGRTLEPELQKLRDRSVRQGPSVAHDLRDVLVAGAGIYGSAASLLLSDEAPRWVASTDTELDEALLVSSRPGRQGLGPWMLDDLPRLLVGQDLELPGLSTRDALSPWQTRMTGLLQLNPLTLSATRVRRLIVVEDNSFNAYRRERYLRLKHLAQDTLTAEPAPGILMLPGRGNAAPRLENEAGLIDMALSLGFRVFDPDLADVRDLMATALGARVLVCVEGDHALQALMWMPPNSVMVSIHAPQRFDLSLKDYCDCVGIRMAIHVAYATGPSSIQADLLQVRTLIDRAQELSARASAEHRSAPLVETDVPSASVRHALPA